MAEAKAKLGTGRHDNCFGKGVKRLLAPWRWRLFGRKPSRSRVRQARRRGRGAVGVLRGVRTAKALDA